MSNMTELLEEIGQLRTENERLEADNRSKNGSMKALGEQIAKLQRAVKNRDKALAKLQEENAKLRVTPASV